MGAFWAVTSGKLTMSTIPSLAIQLNNTFGLFCVLTLLGYGLVAIPRRLWKQSDPDRELRHHLYRCDPLSFCTLIVSQPQAFSTSLSVLAALDVSLATCRLGRIMDEQGEAQLLLADTLRKIESTKRALGRSEVEAHTRIEAMVQYIHTYLGDATAAQPPQVTPCSCVSMKCSINSWTDARALFVSCLAC